MLFQCVASSRYMYVIMMILPGTVWQVTCCRDSNITAKITRPIMCFISVLSDLKAASSRQDATQTMPAQPSLAYINYGTGGGRGVAYYLCMMMSLDRHGSKVANETCLSGTSPLLSESSCLGCCWMGEMCDILLQYKFNSRIWNSDTNKTTSLFIQNHKEVSRTQWLCT